MILIITYFSFILHYFALKYANAAANLYILKYITQPHRFPLAAAQLQVVHRYSKVLLFTYITVSNLTMFWKDFLVKHFALYAKSFKNFLKDNQSVFHIQFFFITIS